MYRLLKKLIYKTYVIFLMGFTVWYGTFMYPLIFGFSGKQQAADSLLELAGGGSEEGQMLAQIISESTTTTSTDLGYRIIEQPRIEGRFHHIGFSLEQDEASLCIRCHGTVPHDKSKEVRSFLNMHAFYLACETCHILPEKGQEAWQFRWYEKHSGERIENPIKLVEVDNTVKRTFADFQRKYVAYGDYGAKVAPGYFTQGGYRFLSGDEEIAFAERYLDLKPSLSAEQESQMRKVIHKKISKDPVQCDRCHRNEQPYIPFSELGYPPRRVQELQSTNVVAMIKKYKEFYLPSFLRPGEGG